MGVATALLAVYALWRITLGASLLDDAHMVGLALRLARGARPFVDEMNFQVLGSLWAAPFAWLWTHAVGITGLVLASRLYFVVIAFGVGYVGYRALLPTFGPLVSALGIAVPLLALPYNILEVSYNTSAMLGLMAATLAGFAALRDDSRWWATAAGVAAAVAAISYPPIALGALAVLGSFAFLGRGRRHLVVAFLFGGALVAVPFAVWLALGIGPAAIADTLAFSRDFMAERGHAAVRTGGLLPPSTLALAGTGLLLALALVLLATLERFPARTRAAALAALPFAAVVPAAVHLALGGDYRFFGVLGSAYLLVVLVLLVVPVAAWSRRGEANAKAAPKGSVRHLFVLTGPLAIVAAPVVAITTSSRTFWGMPIIGVAPLVATVVIGWVLAIAEERPRLAVWAAAGLVGVLVVLLTITPFHNPWPWRLTSRIRSGAFAGVVALPERAAQIDALTRAGRRWVPPGGKVLLMGLPGGYLLMNATIDTGVQWLEDWGPANRWVLRWLEQRGGLPDTVFIAAGPAPAELEQLAQRDPLIAYVLEHYRLAGRAGGMFVLRRQQ